ncbi:tRNA pseudouridine(38-40) synthase TruA [Thiothrix lacustris]|uniref:tRNA pseudouridine(38-40) synthase TruA n=1 Tax=Thiothrix lacustris TaxID=525917 RepID=UPI0027E4E6AB|nr:tRNA pseudouridine(38-40) synthase TruA [Thiothrix lacustris]WMP16636.1 tRNA pseudouridine(38-40) synthase TruA [Thiothrix lacustris]
MKFAACIEYDGSPFYGWQRLSHGPTVQGSVEQALSRVANEEVSVVCAGRTDSGVHGIGQIIHFETSATRPLRGWLFGTNAHLPDGVSMRWIQPVTDDFHARFSARARRYRYVILNRPARPALLHNRVYWQHGELDVAAMHEAAQALLGEQDFSSFRAAGCQARHAMREMIEISVSREGDFIYVDLRANAFLHHMVRNIVGSLLKVGAGERPLTWMGELLALKDRTQAGMTAPASGLYFVHVDYPEHFKLPTTYQLPCFCT